MKIVSHFLKLIIVVFVLKVLVFVHPEKVTEGFQIILNYLDRHARVCFFFFNQVFYTLGRFEVPRLGRVKAPRLGRVEAPRQPPPGMPVTGLPVFETHTANGYTVKI